jgi:hypothetical protein
LVPRTAVAQATARLGARVGPMKVPQTEMRRQMKEGTSPHGHVPTSWVRPEGFDSPTEPPPDHAVTRGRE